MVFWGLLDMAVDVSRDDSSYLGIGIVLGLLIPANHGPPLVGVDEVRNIIADDAGRARKDQGLDARLLAGLDDRPRALDVDLVEDVAVDDAVALGQGAGRVDDDVGADLVKDGDEALGVGNVGVVVLHALAAVAGAAQVDGRHGAALVVVEEHAHNVRAQEATASDH